MRTRLLLFSASLLAAAMALPPGARAQNSQFIVVGAGLGNFRYSTTDDVRAGGLGLDAFDNAAQAQLYVEWYAFGPLGFGLRQHRSGGFQGGGFGYDRDVNVQALLVTGHWVVWGAQDYARVGLLAGVGPVTYEFTLTPPGGASYSDSTSGTEALLGGYLDWGGDGFGARAGVNLVATSIGDMHGASADGSGTGLYLDLRWAFP